ncbi:MAG: hypothetical protein IT285_05405 [Bdellovibrionales bacterium]|nr:hypothetical protein [Bdellovibrionales bacterium]
MRAPTLIASSLALAALTLGLASTGCESTIPFNDEKNYLFSEPGRDLLGAPLESFLHFDEELVDFRKLAGLGTDYTNPEYLDLLFVQRFRIELVSPPGADLSFLNRVTFTIEAPGQDRIVLAYCEGLEESRTAMECRPSADDLAPYLRPTDHRIRTQIEESSRPETTVLLRLKAQVHMRVEQNAYHPEPVLMYGM